MPDDAVKAQRELCVFQDFVTRSGLGVVQGTAENRPPPAPDILCEISGEGLVAFELKELCDEPIARVIGDQLKTGIAQATYVRGGLNWDDLLKKVRNKRYETAHPLELVFYTDGRIVAPPDTIIPRIRLYFEHDLHQFRRVWFMGQPGETCECVVGALEAQSTSMQQGTIAHQPDLAGA